MVFSSDKDFTLHPDPGTQLIIDPNATRLQLPVLGGIDSAKKAFAQ